MTVVGQVLIVTLGGKVFNVEPLSTIDWLVIALATSSVLVFAEIARRVRIAIKKGASGPALRAPDAP